VRCRQPSLLYSLHGSNATHVQPRNRDPSFFVQSLDIRRAHLFQSLNSSETCTNRVLVKIVNEDRRVFWNLFSRFTNLGRRRFAALYPINLIGKHAANFFCMDLLLASFIGSRNSLVLGMEQIKLFSQRACRKIHLFNSPVSGLPRIIGR